jgi:hypothetical protein
MLAMASRYNPERPLRINPLRINPAVNEAIIITNPLGLQQGNAIVHQGNAVVQRIAAPVTGRTPIHKPREWYDDERNADSFVSKRCKCCTGMSLIFTAPDVTTGFTVKTQSCPLLSQR